MANVLTTLNRWDGELIIRLILVAMKGGQARATLEHADSLGKGAIWNGELALAGFMKGAEEAMRLEVHGKANGTPTDPAPLPPVVLQRADEQLVIDPQTAAMLAKVNAKMKAGKV